MVAVQLERGCRLQSGGSIPDCLPVVGPSAAGRHQEWHASAGNRARVTSMATMYSTTRPLMLLVLVPDRTAVALQVLEMRPVPWLFDM